MTLASERAEASIDTRHPSDEPAKSLVHSVRDGCAHAAMLGFGEAYLAPFAIFLRAGSFAIGLLASLPLLVGTIAQMGSVYLLDRAPRRKPIVLGAASLQGLCWIPLYLAPVLLPKHGPLLLVCCALGYFASASFLFPAWNSWMGDLVDPQTRGRYFGRRDRLRALFQLGAFLAAGLLLSAGRRLGHEGAAFGVLFGAAFLARWVSIDQLRRMVEPAYRRPTREDTFSLWEFLRKAPRSNFGRFTLYVAALYLTTHLASPFFVLYMLRELRFSYLQFTATSLVSLGAQSLTYANWGRVSDRFGNRAILQITGLLIPVIPFLWLFSREFPFILAINAVSGLLWSGFNLSAANFLFDAVRPSKRPRCVAYYGLVVHAGVFLGATLGGWVAPRLSEQVTLLGWTMPLFSGLQTLFLVSALARLAVSIVFLPVIREERTVEKPTVWKVIVQMTGLSPIRGIRLSVFGGVHPTERARKGEEPRDSKWLEPPA